MKKYNYELMADCNGVTMHAGDIVKVSNTFYKNMSGYFFIEHAPNDGDWSGGDYSLTKISKAGKISKAKYSGIFYPFAYFSNNQEKNAEAYERDKKNAKIEIVRNIDTSEIIQYFEEEASRRKKRLEGDVLYYGEGSRPAEISKNCYTATLKKLEHIKATTPAITEETTTTEPEQTTNNAEEVQSVIIDANYINDLINGQKETAPEPAGLENITDTETQPAEPETATPDKMALFAAYMKAKQKKTTATGTPKATAKEEPQNTEKTAPKATEPTKAEEKATETEQTMPNQEEQKKPLEYGYTGTTSEELTAEQIQELETTHTASIYRRRPWNTAQKTRYKYMLEYHTDKTGIIYRREQDNPGESLQYIGIINKSQFFDSVTLADVATKYAEDIESEIKKQIPDEATAKEKAKKQLATLEEWRKKDFYNRFNSVTPDTVKRVFLGVDKNALYYYTISSEKISHQSLINYIENPKKEIETAATEYIQKNILTIYNKIHRYNEINKGINETKANPGHPLHTYKAIYNAITTQKSVKIELNTGAILQADASRLKYSILADRPSLSSWGYKTILGEAPKDERGRNKDIQIQEIKAITYKGKPIYKADTAPIKKTA